MDHKKELVKDALFDVSGKTIVVTGGFGLLGRAFTRSLVERGSNVAVFDCQTRSGDFPVPGDLFKDNLLCLPVDVTDRSSVQEGLSQVASRWGVPHGLVNNAALDSPPGSSVDENGPFESYPGSSWDKIMQVNVKGVFHTCQIIGEQMAKAGRGSIINIGSIYGLVSPDQRVYDYRGNGEASFFKPAAYAASKSALLNLTRYLSTYWAGQGVRVNTLTFGGVFDGQDTEFLKRYSLRVPLGRMAQADEYNGAVIFLLSDASSYMTGSNLIIDGGWTAW